MLVVEVGKLVVVVVMQRQQELAAQVAVAQAV
jgi:hypothetical protein